MGSFSINSDTASGCTIISNRFIDEYMLEANDAQLKVYLYLSRMMNSNMSTSISDIADKFNHTEKDVERALRYWERAGLLVLSYDASKNIENVRLAKIGMENSAMLESAPAVAKSVVPVQQYIPAPVVAAASHVTEVKTSIPAPKVADKPSYSLDDMKAFRQDEEAQQILFISEQYVGKPLTPGDIKTLIYLHKELHFTMDLIDYLVQYCVERGHRDFRYIEKVGVSWAEADITTAAEAANFAEQYSSSTYTICKSLGRLSDPTTKEIDLISRWTGEYSFSQEVILEACTRAVNATEKHRFEYADGILANWKKQNVQSVADVTKLDEAFSQNKAAMRSSTAKTGGQSGNNKFNTFQQNSYDFSQLEREILSN